jgi:uncharacterized NAD(P)/FAD-binding protein YdhS
MFNHKSTFNIAIIGVGPRGTYAFERLIAFLSDANLTREVKIHLIEPSQFAAGVVYNTNQPNYLLMNTVSSQITAFPDETVENRGPLFDGGKTLFEWLNDNDEPIDPNDYPTRSQHGRYLKYVLDFCMRNKSANINVECHKNFATDIIPQQRNFEIELDNRKKIIADKILLTTGNVGSNNSARVGIVNFDEYSDNKINFEYIPSPYPLPDTLSSISKTSTVGILGLGLTFIDAVLALTVGRGGKFVRKGNTLNYRPSGREPSILAWSRSGRPLLVRGINQKGYKERYKARHLTINVVNSLREQHGKLDFKEHVLPLIIKDMGEAYSIALKKLDTSLRDKYPDFISWGSLVLPEAFRKKFYNSSDYKESLIHYMLQDIEEASLGNKTSPFKASCDVLRDIRDNIRYAVEFEGLTPHSHKYFLSHFVPINNRLAVGPPLIRNEQLIALIKAGILDIFFGKEPKLVLNDKTKEVNIKSTEFILERREKIDILVDGRITASESILIRNLIMRKIARIAANREKSKFLELRSLEVSRHNHIVSGSGEINKSISALGQVAEGTLWYTQVAARPFVNSRAIFDAARWAKEITLSINNN